MYDMKPVRLSKRSSYVTFTDEMEQAMSSQRHLGLLRAPLLVTYGTEETPEFQRQSRDFAAAVKDAGKPVQLIEAVGYNHFEMAEIARPSIRAQWPRRTRDDEIVAVGGVARRME